MKSFIIGAYHASKLILQNNAPTIMVTSGVVSMGVGAVIGARKTLELETVLEQRVNHLEQIENGRQDVMLTEYDDNAARRDRVKIYTRTAGDLTKLYFIPGTLFLAGAGLVFGGHHILMKRNATLAIALTTVQKAYDTYRARVVSAMGPEFDQRMVSGKVLVDVVNEQGEIVGQQETDLGDIDPYNRVFSQETSSEWYPDLGTNIGHISNIQTMCNQRLVLQGQLYLNDVYKALGLAQSDIGQVAGWKSKILPDGSKDIPIVDFGINTPHVRDEELFQDHAVYLDFNCQGFIVGGAVQKALEKA